MVGGVQQGIDVGCGGDGQAQAGGGCDLEMGGDAAVTGEAALIMRQGEAEAALGF